VSGDLSQVPIIAVKLFAIMDPFSVIPYILGIFTSYQESTQQNVSWSYLVNKISMVIVVILLIFAVLGRLILDFLGLSPASLEIGGGIILVYLGIDTMGGFGQLRFLSRSIEEAIVTPIATPLIVGPGTLTALVTLSVNYSILVLIAGSLIAALLTYISLMSAPLLVKVLGRTGTIAAGRFTAVIIAAFGVQLILGGLTLLNIIH
jgi:Multiple antibiotic transporter